MARRYWKSSQNKPWENLTDILSGASTAIPESKIVSGAGAGMGLGGPVGAGIGALVGGIGEGITAGLEAEQYDEAMALKTRQQEEEEKQNAFARRYQTRNQNMQGLGMLADWRTQGMQNMRGQIFKDDLLRAINGR